MEALEPRLLLSGTGLLDPLALPLVADVPSAVLDLASTETLGFSASSGCTYAPEAALPDLLGSPVEPAAPPADQPPIAVETQVVAGVEEPQASRDFIDADESGPVASLESDQQTNTDELVGSLHAAVPPPGLGNTPIHSDPYPFEFSLGGRSATLSAEPADPTILTLSDTASGRVLQSRPLSLVSQVTILGSHQADDKLIIDFSVPFSTDQGILFNGGMGGTDSLVLRTDSETLVDSPGANELRLSEGSDSLPVSFQRVEETRIIKAADEQIIYCPGDSPGIQQANGLTWDGGDTYIWQINDVSAGLQRH